MESSDVARKTVSNNRVRDDIVVTFCERDGRKSENARATPDVDREKHSVNFENGPIRQTIARDLVYGIVELYGKLKKKKNELRS